MMQPTPIHPFVRTCAAMLGVALVDLEALAAESSRQITADASPIAYEIQNAPLGEGLDRDAAVGLDAETRATAWASYGFKAPTVAAWLAAGVSEPAVASELRASRIDPDDEDLSAEVDGMAWARALDEAHRSIVDFLAFQETGEVAC